MVSNSLLTAAQELGFTYVEKNPSENSYLYGVYGGYLVSLFDQGNNRTLFINYYLQKNDSDEDDSVKKLEVSESLKEVLTTRPIVNYEVEKDYLECTLNCKVGEMFEVLDSIIELLNKAGLKGVTNCSACGNKIGKRFPKKVNQDKCNFLLCEHCALEAVENQDNAQKPDLPESKPIPGLIGALVGGLIGIAVYFVLYYFLLPIIGNLGFDSRYLFTIAGFLTAFLVFKGYTLFSKRACVSESVIVTLVTIVCTAIGQYFGSFSNYALTQGFTLPEAMKVPSMWLVHLRTTLDSSLSYSDDVTSLYSISGVFYKLLLLSMLFAVIGSVLFQIGLSEKSKVKIKPLEVETLKIKSVNKEETSITEEPVEHSSKSESENKDFSEVASEEVDSTASDSEN